MAVLELVLFPDERLRVVTKAVEVFDDAFKAFTRDMQETMVADQGVGLAATQVGSDKRVFVMNCAPDRSRPFVVVNPEIIDKENVVIMSEACLSFPGLSANVKRATKVHVKYQDADGQPHETTFTDLEAQCYQHELEHLDGILFVDHLSPLKRKMAEKRLAKTQKLMKQ